jgi:rhodanese-related sulfurtransferase
MQGGRAGAAFRKPALSWYPSSVGLSVRARILSPFPADIEMKSTCVQLLLILALAGAAGTVYNLANAGNHEKYLKWVNPSYRGSDTLAPPPAAAPTAPAPPPSAPRAATPPPQEAPPAGAATTAAPAAKEAPAAPAAPSEFPMIGIDLATKEYNDGTLFLDARRTRDYEAGHIPGARSFSAHEADLADKIASLHEEQPLEAPIIIYCTNSKDCEDSKIVGRQLKEVGFVNLSIFSGGFPEWEKEKRPIVKGKEPGKREDA